MIHTVYFAYASIKQFRIHISHSRTFGEFPTNTGYNRMEL